VTLSFDHPIVDTHVHLWDPNHFRMPWLDGNDAIAKPFGLSDYREHTAGLNIGAFVYIEVAVAPHYGLLEARWVVDRANEDPRLQAIVAAAPVEFGERARAYLDALVAIDPRIKGVRRSPSGDPSDPGYGLNPDFVRGVQLLGEYGLTFDLVLSADRLPMAAELVSRCPGTQFILDHIGGPDIVGKQREPWFGGITQLATLPNIICKVSGVATAADREHWTVADIAPYVEHVLDAFGEDRVAYGSDWPVALLGTPYTRWVEALDEITKSFSPEAKRKLWAGNAKRFYGLAGNA